MEAVLVCTSILLVEGKNDLSLLVKKGVREILFEFRDKMDTAAVVWILNQTRKPAAVSNLLSNFPLERRAEIEKMIEQLLKLKILINYHESKMSSHVLDCEFHQALDNFFWEKEVNWYDFLDYRTNITINIIGFNNFSCIIIDSLLKIGILDINLVNYPYILNKNIENNLNKYKSKINVMEFNEFIDKKKSNSLIVVTDEFGNLPSLVQLNNKFFSEKQPFLSIFVLSEIGYIGPMVIPGKTSCLNCFISRLENKTEALNPLNLTELQYFQSQNQLSFHPSLITILAHLFIFNLTSVIRFNLSCSKKETNSSINFSNYCNNVTEFDLNSSMISRRHILPNPACFSCRQFKGKQKIIFDFAKETVY